MNKEDGMAKEGPNESILDSHPALYEFLYQTRDSLRLIFGFLGGVKKYVYKKRWHWKFKESWVYFNISPNDTRCDVRVGRHSFSSSMIGIEWVPANEFQYKMRVGSFTHISNNLRIILSKAHTLDLISNNLNSLFLDRRGHSLYHKYHKEEYGNVEIGNDVWIGDDVIIIGNVRIGDGAVIGARSVVTRSIEPYAIAAGAPAKRIRYRFDKKRREKLVRIKWWHWSDEKIEANLNLFYHPRRFIAKNK